MGGGTGGLTLVDVINKDIEYDAELDITFDPPYAASVTKGWYSYLFARTPIKSLIMRGMLHIPPQCVSEEGSNNNDDQRLVYVEFPDAIYAGSGAFRNQKNLKTAKLPSLQVGYENYVKYSNNMFYGCVALETVDLGNLAYLADSMLRGCSSLALLDLKAVTNIETNVFYGDTNLKTIIIRSNAVPTLASTAAFSGSAFASNGSGGTLYVPNSLIASYQAANNWSTILGYANNQIKPIEGSIYDT